MSYKSRPTDTMRVAVPPGLLDPTERVAKHSHDIWAKRRMSEGWTYGPAREVAAKMHRDLVPYSILPESEKEYDRVTGMETLKATVALG